MTDPQQSAPVANPIDPMLGGSLARKIDKSSFKPEVEDLQELFVIKRGFEEIERILNVMNSASGKINWVRICPDGLVGGRGFIMQVAELQEAMEKIRRLAHECKSSVYDECYNNPHWKDVKEKHLTIRKEAPLPPPPEPLAINLEESDSSRFDEIDYDFGVDGQT